MLVAGHRDGLVRRSRPSLVPRGVKWIDPWWMQNRGAAPNCFVEELADALALLGMETASVVDNRTGQFRLTTRRRVTTTFQSSIATSSPDHAVSARSAST